MLLICLRDIHISDGEVNGNIVITIRNPIEHDLKHKDGKFVTKKNKAHHGYVLTNVRHIVEKYDGTLTFKVVDSTFSVCWMIPITDNKKQL